jgi:hypothetical protein
MNCFGANIVKDNSPRYLKIEDKILGIINDDNSVTVINKTLHVIFAKDFVTRETFESFLKERVFSFDRRDVSAMLDRLSISKYDVFAIASKTRAFSLSDKFWLSYDEKEKYSVIFITIFEKFFGNSMNSVGDYASSPGGACIKTITLVIKISVY